MARTVKNGDTVRVHYTGTLGDGTVFDSSVLNGRPPLEFKVGAGMMIPGFDRGVVGMAAGETRKLRLPPEDAYGAYRDDLLFIVSADCLPKGYAPRVGDELTAGRRPVSVKAVNEDGSVVLDANARFAGKELNFEVTLVEIL